MFKNNFIKKWFLVCLNISIIHIAFAQSGMLDISFNNTGNVVTPISVSGFNDFTTSMAIQSDGKILVAGHTYNSVKYDIFVARYLSNGILDSTFDNDGIVITDYNGNSEYAFSLLIQPDGKILIGGTINNSLENDILLIRYNADGSLDASFDTDGIVNTHISNSDDDINTIALQPDGKIVAGGNMGQTSGNNDFLFLRYNPNGSLDSSFNNTGIVNISVGNYLEYVNALRIQPDGKIVAAGKCKVAIPTLDDIALIRLLPNGILDSTFDNDGIVITDFGISSSEKANALVIQTDGKIVAAGMVTAGSNVDMVIIRYKSDGSLDSTFNSDGIFNIISTTTVDFLNAMTLQSDGKILVTGCSSASLQDFVLYRLNTNGSFDSSFNFNGKAIVDINNHTNCANAIAIQNDSKILIAGVSGANNNLDVGILRFHAAPVSANNIHYSNNINVFPNPTSDKITIQNTNNVTIDNITIYSVLGEVLFTSTKTIENISLSHFAMGIYYIAIDVSGRNYIYKITKQ